MTDLTTSSTPTSLSRSLRADLSARDASRLSDQQAFSAVLSRARGAEKQDDERGRARKAAEDFVAQALVEPVLKQMRETTQAAAPFAPNQAEKSFRTMMDSAMAQRIVKSGNWSLVDRVADRILARSTSSSAAQPLPLLPFTWGPTTPEPMLLTKEDRR